MRFIILLFGGIIFFSCSRKIVLPAFPAESTASLYKPNQAPFYHGVASGDPLSDAVIIWTRVTPKHVGTISVTWEVALTENFEKIVKSGKISTDESRDYTVKHDVQGLKSDQQYYYRFKSLGAYSPVGKTKTTAAGPTAKVNLGVVSCSNYEWGYFSAYRHLAEKDLDAVIHLGDYIYEYAAGGYGDTTIGRKHLPDKELLELEDYRTRYAQYRLDPDLQEVHRQHPFIVIWDDHEISNNAYVDGAQNHQDDEGNYELRKLVAKKVYSEWMPIRDQSNKQIYRSMTFGNLAHLIMLDERIAGRTAPPPTADDINDQAEMLGSQQYDWLVDELNNDKAAWKIIGNQVIFSELDISLARPKSPRNLDAWDGYPSERRQLLEFMEDNGLKNNIIITGDTHSSWAFDVTDSASDYRESQKSYAVEFGTPSISSANMNERNTDEEVMMGEQALLMTNQHLKYVNMRDHGYLILKITPDKVSSSWYYVDNLKSPTSNEVLAKTISVKVNSGKLNSEEK